MPGFFSPESLVAATAITGMALLSGSSARADQFEFFEKHIRPVLVENCYKCHSSESEKLKGELYLDSREGMLRGGATGPSIVPGNAEKSLLIKAIRRLDEDLAMPPKKALPPEVIENFISWVNSGAPDPRQGKTNSIKATIPSGPGTFWSFLPPKDPAIPKVKDLTWPKTPVDHFILDRLEEKGLRPSPPTEKRTLIRRASFDLTGLPPTADEVNAFIRDTSKDAFARVVERLLASPRYGERWGRYWLDVARYADNKGYVYGDREEGRFVHSHAYRDWVIKAFNDDMPYDRFLLLQLAADQVETNHSSYAAMGFLTLGRRFLGVMHDIIDDRIDTVTRAAQGLTVSCARCHDHKFDPISTRDYYSLYGIFAGSSEKTVPLFSGGPGPESAYEKELQKRVDKLNSTFQSKKEKLTDSLRKKVSDYLVAQLTADQLPSEEFYAIRGPDDLNPYIVRQWQAFLFNAGKEFHPVFAPWHAFAGLAEKEFASKAPEVWKQLTNAQPNKLNPIVVKSISTNFPSSMKAVAELYGRLFNETDLKWRQLTSATNSAGQKVNTNLTQLPNPSEEELRLVLYAPDSPVQVPNGAIVDLEWFFDEGARVELGKLQSEIDRWNIQSDAAPPYAVILEDRKNQRNARVFKRGNPASKGEEVPRQYLEIISGKDRKAVSKGSGRLEMAEAITSPKNPLTARVMVNRIWLHHFGSGLVKTPSDFGTRSEPPSHPELLDYLACRFMNDGWSIKNQHRLLMLSQVYQQASDLEEEPTRALTGGGSVHAKQSNVHGLADSPRDSASSALAEKLDPENRLLWRMNRQRLDFEAMRDSLLAVSGELDARMGGKPVEIFKTPAPRRRTVYGFVDRQFLPGILRVFDFANPDMHSPQRHHTTVPQQALFFMNSPFVVDRARALGVGGQGKNVKPEEAIRGYYRCLYQRDPTAAEINAGLRFIAESAAEPVPEPPPPVVMQWKYGYGEFDTNTQRTKNFYELPHFTGEAWQGGAKWPDEKLGWVQLNREGGHTGNDLQHAAIRRWVAPYDAVVGISGQVKHEHKEGDGIQARLISSRSGLLGTWTLHNKKEDTKVEALEVKKGDALDFMADLGGNLNNDDFKWTPIIKVNTAKTVNNPEQGYETEWEAKKEFSGPPEPPPKPLTPWEKYAQVLLLANEFIFVD